MKLLGAGIMWLAAGFTGVYEYLKMKRRTELLKKTSEFFTRLKIRMKYTSDDLRGLMEFMLDFDPGFLSELLSKMRDGMDFPFAFESAVKESALPYKEEERLKLLSFGKSFGTMDLFSEEKMISLYESYFSDYCKDASEFQKRYGRLTLLSGFLFGSAVFVMII